MTVVIVIGCGPDPRLAELLEVSKLGEAKIRFSDPDEERWVPPHWWQSEDRGTES